MMVYHEHYVQTPTDSTLKKIKFRLTPRVLIVMETGIPRKKHLLVSDKFLLVGFKRGQ